MAARPPLPKRSWLIALAGLWLVVGGAWPAGPAAAAGQLFGLPFDTPPGPSTWLVIQLYGNTVSAYRWRRVMYGAGQGLHFGLDFAARCGTPVVAIGDGVVTKVDAEQHGAGPHNLMIDHPNGYASFYGHLVERAQVDVGQAVTRGQVVGYTGDPDLTCASRPHLHLEIRSGYNYRTAYNPVPLIDADWDSLMLSGPFARGFERDLDNPRQWQALDDQPEVNFGGAILNDYARPWPPEWLTR
ncbi:MAG: M23 family metallopeptidase [Anaerolineales bacterium]|nr:M23 family metallopeptidase [Anaerolineales bacterium]